jgi:hypothetical protein
MTIFVFEAKIAAWLNKLFTPKILKVSQTKPSAQIYEYYNLSYTFLGFICPVRVYKWQSFGFIDYPKGFGLREEYSRFNSADKIQVETGFFGV